MTSTAPRPLLLKKWKGSRSLYRLLDLLNEEGEVIPEHGMLGPQLPSGIMITLVEDASTGVHNPTYTRALFEAAFAGLGEQAARKAITRTLAIQTGLPEWQPGSYSPNHTDFVI